MTANYFAKVVESLYHKVDIEKMSAGFDTIKKYDFDRISDDWVNRQITEKSYFRWCEAVGLFESYLLKNYESFEETELVYKWGKNICDRRNSDFNRWRVSGGYLTFNEWLKKN
jgi:hypothetical protein